MAFVGHDWWGPKIGSHGWEMNAHEHSGGHSKLALNMEIKQHFYNQECWLIPPHQRVNLEHIGSYVKHPFTLVFVKSLIL